jgi:hypothetical protein
VKSTKRKPIKRNFATARAERGHIRTHHAEVSTPGKTISVPKAQPSLTSTPRTAGQTPQAGQTTSAAVLHTPDPPRNPNTQSKRVSLAPTWRTRPNTPPPTVAQAQIRPNAINPTATATPVPGTPIASVQPSPEKKTTPATAIANTTRGKGKSFVPPRPVGVMPITSHLPTPDKSPSVNQAHGGFTITPRRGRTGPRQKVKSLLLGIKPKTKTAPTPKSKSKQTHSQLSLQSGSKFQEKKKVTGGKGRQAVKNGKEVDLDEAEDGEWDEHGMWKPAPASERATRPAGTALDIDQLAEDDKGGEEEEDSEAVETLHQNVTKWLSDVESDTAEVPSAHSDPNAQASERTKRRLTLPARRKSAIQAISLEKERMPLSPLPTQGANHIDRDFLLDRPASSRRLDSNNLTAQLPSRSLSVDRQNDLVTDKQFGLFGKSPTPNFHNTAAFPSPPQTRQRSTFREEEALFLVHSDNGDDDDSEDEGSVNEPIRRPITRRSRDPRAIYALSRPFWYYSESRGSPPAGRSGLTRSVSSTKDCGYDENIPSGPKPRRHYPLSPSLAPSPAPAEKTNIRRSVSFAGRLIEQSPLVSRRKVTTFKSSRKSGAPPPLGERKRRRKSGSKIAGGKARETKRRREAEHKRTRARHSIVSKFIDDEAVEDNEEQEETEAGSDDHDERLRGTSVNIQASDGEDTLRTEGMANSGHGGRSALRRIGEVVVADDDPFAYMSGHLPPLRNRDILPQPYNAENVDASPLRLDHDETEVSEEDDGHDYRGAYEQSEEENGLQEEGEEGEAVDWIPGSGFDITPPTQNPDSARPPEINGKRRKTRLGREGHALTALAAGRKHPSRARGKSKKAGSVSHWMLQQVDLDEEAPSRKKVAGGNQRSRKRPWPHSLLAGDEDTEKLREVTKALPLQVDRSEKWEWDDTDAHAHEEWQGRGGRRPNRPTRRHARPDEEDEDEEEEEEEMGIRKAGKLSLSRNDSVAEKQAR